MPRMWAKNTDGQRGERAVCFSLHAWMFLADIYKVILTPMSTLDPSVFVNYRPISNLPFLSKIPEKTVGNQMRDLLHNDSFSQVLECIIAHSTGESYK